MSVLSDQGMQANQQITFLSDGADNVRDLQYIMYPESEYVLDWFHITMRLTVLNQFAPEFYALLGACEGWPSIKIRREYVLESLMATSTL